MSMLPFPGREPQPACTCCDDAGWLHSIDLTNIGESYHPTATGQADGYLPTFSAAATSVGQ